MREQTQSYAPVAHSFDTDIWGEVGNVRHGSSSIRGWADPSVASRPLRIAVFVNEFPALSETFVLNQVTGLLDLGHDVTIFANGSRHEPTVHPDVARYGLRERIRYRAMPKSRGIRLWRAPGIVAGGGQRRFSPLLRALDASAYGREALSLNMFYWSAALLDEKPFDIIHCHFGIVGRAVAYLREIGAIRGKLVVTFHGVDVSACLDHDANLYRHLFAHLDLALPVSDHWRRRLIDHGCDPARIRVHHMGIDPTRFRFKTRPRHAMKPFHILTIGRLVDKKGHEHGLRAVASLMSMGIPVQYTLLGDGPLASQLSSLARDLKIGHCVDFCGWQNQDSVISHLQESDVLLAPSVTDAKGDQEGIPVTLMEAMACGLPIVSSVHSGIPELVEHGISGLLAAERDVAGLTEALVALWRSPSLGERVGAAARAKVIRDYDIHALNRDLERHFRSLLSR